MRRTIGPAMRMLNGQAMMKFQPMFWIQSSGTFGRIVAMPPGTWLALSNTPKSDMMTTIGTTMQELTMTGMKRGEVVGLTKSLKATPLASGLAMNQSQSMANT